VDQVLEPHRAYWRTEAAMAEGSPLMILERGEAVRTPPMLCVQGADDIAHPRPQLEAFAARYRAAGGTIDIRLFDGQEQSFILQDPASPAAKQAMTEIIRFVHAAPGGGAAR
jgi:acetyl esterase/lipase